MKISSLVIGSCLGVVFIASQAFSYPKIDPGIKSEEECSFKGGDWDQSAKLCTVYIADHDSLDCTEEKPFQTIVQVTGVLSEDNFVQTVCGSSEDDSRKRADNFCRFLIQDRPAKFESCEIIK